MMQHKEGDLYKVIELEGVRLEIRYGYYDPPLERGNIEPMPIFPDLATDPLYTKEGYLLVTADQEICECFAPVASASEEGWCHDCRHLTLYEECLGICKCEDKRKNYFKTDIRREL